jgi:hypothetical protein
MTYNAVRAWRVVQPAPATAGPWAPAYTPREAAAAGGGRREAAAADSSSAVCARWGEPPWLAQRGAPLTLASARAHTPPRALQDGSEYWVMAANLKRIFEEKFAKAVKDDEGAWAG